MCTPSTSSAPCVAPPVPPRTCRSPQFDEDDKDLSEMKLIRTESSVGAESRSDCKDDGLLPKAFLDLEIIFELVIRILATAHVRGGKRGTPLGNLKDDMLRLYQRSLRKEHLKQILALVPDCLIVSHAWKDGKFCHRTVSINTSRMNLRPGEQIIHAKFLEDMKSSLRQSNLSFVRARYTEFLQTHHPHLKLDPERKWQWHADFDLSLVQLPIIDLPPLPQAQASTASFFYEKNAESKFRTAADALRCLFRQRDTRALPVADVLKVLQQSRGLTFKSNLDAVDMLNDIVEKLPNFFSKKTFPSQGKGLWIMFSSSELFPWHQPRVYPQTKQ